MPVNQMLPFAIGPTPDVLTNAQYVALPERANGFETGIALSTKLNSVWRQSAFMTHALGQVLNDRLNEDVLDNKNTATLISQIKRLLDQTAVLRTPMGKIEFLPYDEVPNGYIYAAGQAVSRTTYAALFAKIGTSYGAGNGTTTFNVPDYRGVALFGKDNMGGTAANRLTAAGSGINGNVVGAMGGSQFSQQHTHGAIDAGHSHSLNNPSHTHGTTDPTHTHGVYDPAHTHGAWTDAQGYHAHAHGSESMYNFYAGGAYIGERDWVYSGPNLKSFFSQQDTSAGGIHAHNVGVGAARTSISLYGAYTGVTVNGAATAVSANTGYASLTVNASGTGTSQNIPPAAVAVVVIYTGVFV